MFMSITLRKLISMKQTKHGRKSEAQTLCSKCPPFVPTHAFKRLHYCAVATLMMVWSSSLHSLSRRSFKFSTPSHHGSANGRPSLEEYPRCCSPPDWRIWWPHLWRDKIWRLSLQHGDSVTCTVNGMISWRQHFRGIAISSILSKVFEYCLLDRFKDYFVSADNQFGF